MRKASRGAGARAMEAMSSEKDTAVVLAAATSPGAGAGAVLGPGAGAGALEVVFR